MKIDIGKCIHGGQVAQEKCQKCFAYLQPTLVKKLLLYLSFEQLKKNHNKCYIIWNIQTLSVTLQQQNGYQKAEKKQNTKKQTTKTTFRLYFS